MTNSKHYNIYNVIGKNIYDAVDIIEDVGLQVEIEGSGSVVIDQFPYENAEVVKNGIVAIKTQ